jgi:hypothetical protein
VGLNNKPFPRRDKRNEHVRKIHKHLSIDVKWFREFDAAMEGFDPQANTMNNIAPTTPSNVLDENYQSDFGRGNVFFQEFWPNNITAGMDSSDVSTYIHAWQMKLLLWFWISRIRTQS